MFGSFKPGPSHSLKHVQKHWIPYANTKVVIPPYAMTHASVLDSETDLVQENAVDDLLLVSW